MRKRTSKWQGAGDRAADRRRKRVRVRWVESRAAGATVFACIANLANTNMGVGMLALPAAMSNAGYVGGTLLLLFSVGIAAFGSHLLGECVNTIGRPASLSTVTSKALGAPGIILTDASVVIISTSCAIGYLIVVGDMLPEIVEWFVVAAGGETSGHTARELWILAAVPIVAPLAFLQKLESLGPASSLVVGCVGIIIVTVLAYAAGAVSSIEPCVALLPPGNSSFSPAATSNHSSCADDEGRVGSVVSFRDLAHTLSSLPTFLFAFAAQINVPSIVSELRRPTPARVARVLLGGVAFTAAAYLVVAGGAYSTYGSAVSADLLVSYPKSAIVARVAMVVVVLLSHPVVSYPVGPCIANMRATLTHGALRSDGLPLRAEDAANHVTIEASAEASSRATTRGEPSAYGATSAERPRAPAIKEATSLFVSEREQVIIRAVYLTGTTLTALLVTDLGIVVSLAGAASATAVIFIAPGTCYCTLLPQGSLQRGAAALAALGCVLMPVLVVLVLMAHGQFGDQWVLDDTG
eukprot:CAMPEP_0115829710 /NCGR_PEP_ID=MMETSP0287-20121206/1241_1 /TAXON_ID=412157 /ORGANISM="Chrysochromulina rotalis, Strain UIO044" /LENGTH=523 /DNA_ID=CAMNT_0003282989 /DNA_START=73 /DNA_END=1644 /DNA_ORIENTATION=-